jgi:hypothetical protein
MKISINTVIEELNTYKLLREDKMLRMDLKSATDVKERH